MPLLWINSHYIYWEKFDENWFMTTQTELNLPVLNSFEISRDITQIHGCFWFDNSHCYIMTTAYANGRPSFLSNLWRRPNPTEYRVYKLKVDIEGINEVEKLNEPYSILNYLHVVNHNNQPVFSRVPNLESFSSWTKHVTSKGNLQSKIKRW